MKHPPRWQDCKPFVKALIDRGYVGTVTVFGKKSAGVQLHMSAGIYLYMYELWQDGVSFGGKSTAKKSRKP